MNGSRTEENEEKSQLQLRDSRDESKAEETLSRQMEDVPREATEDEPSESPRDSSSDDSAKDRPRDLEKGNEKPERQGSLGGSKASSARREDGKRLIREEECYETLGDGWPTWKKWMLLSAIFAVQVSMNFNTSAYPSAINQISDHFNVSQQAARVSQLVFLVLYAFGCELWAPWSEEFGRWPVLQLSLFLVNIWQILGALAPNFGTVIVARALGGLSSAGGSVTLGMVADLYQAETQQWAVAFIVLSSVLGTSIGPVIGGPLAAFMSWRWNFWIQLIFGGAVQAIHFFMPESRSTILMDREAKRRRKSGEDPNVYGPNELKKPRISLSEFAITWIRPFEMFIKEPIVLTMSLLSGFSDALIFTFQQGFPLVYAQWGFTTVTQGLTFIPILIGYFIAYFSYFPFIARDIKVFKKHGADAVAPERRLYWLLWLAPLETIGLFGFAWTSLGPPQVPWIAPMIFSTLVAIANFAIYMSTVDYMIAAYGVYSASATGGNGFARDFLAGIAALYATPLYENIAPNGLHLEYGSTVLACLAAVVTIPIYVCYWKGPSIRSKSKFAVSLDMDRKARGGRRVSEATSEQLQPRNL